MNPGLLWLLRRAPRTLLRSLRRRFRGPRGLVLGIGLAVMVVAILLPSLLDTMFHDRDPGVAAENARRYGPLSMLLMTGMTLLAPAQRRGGLYFRPAEVGLLFPAPVTRRELLAYHVLSRGQIQLLSALWVSVFVVRYAPTWYGCFLGVSLALIFLQLVSQAAALLTAAAGRRLAWPLRWGLLAAVVLVLILGGVDAASAIRMEAGYVAALDALLAHPAVDALTRLFVPFANAFAGASLGEVALWSGVSLALVLLVLLLIARLDVAYEEAALDVSRQVRRKLDRMRAGGGALSALGPSRARFAVPSLPFAGGAGPVAWRQCVEIARNGRAVGMALLMLLLWPAIMGGTIFVTAPEEADSVEKMGTVLAGMLLFFSFISTQSIGFDFRRDLDRIAFLRSLPVSPLAVAAGQVGPTAVLLAGLQTAAVGAVVVVADLLPAYVVPAALPALLPLTWAAIALDNMLFLLFPHRIDPDDAGNVGFMGRLMLVMVLKMTALFVLVTVAALFGLVVFLPTRSMTLAVLGGMGLVVAVDVVLTWLVARAYDAFDPGRDTPA